jgi:chromatin segregation and condensation protein Rec8/ScpA/Scc1 (kleisin family)
VKADTKPLRYYVAGLAHKMREHRRLSLRDAVFMLDDEPTRESLIGSFCALLELCKLGIVRVVQVGSAADIGIELVARTRTTWTP